MLMANILLAALLWNSGWIYRLIISGYLVLLLIALKPAADKIPKLGPMARFFLLSMGAVLNAWYKVIVGRETKTWEPSHR